MKQVIFDPVPERDGSFADEPEYDVIVDGEPVCRVPSGEIDFRSRRLAPLWLKLDVKIRFIKVHEPR